LTKAMDAVVLLECLRTCEWPITYNGSNKKKYQDEKQASLTPAQTALVHMSAMFEEDLPACFLAEEDVAGGLVVGELLGIGPLDRAVSRDAVPSLLAINK